MYDIYELVIEWMNACMHNERVTDASNVQFPV